MTEELTTSSRRVRADDRPVSGKSHAVEEPLGRGATIGRYVVLGLVGRGGMGDVYAAYDPELDRKVAVKLVRTPHDRRIDVSEGRSRLLREAQAIARLSHPNVVVVYDVGTFGDSVFIAMEFVDGQTVGYWRHAATRTWREVLAVFVAAGRGLGAAHQAGMIHRDFKPDNVMVTGDGQVRVMDFGLARQVIESEDREATTASRLAARMAAATAAGYDPESTVPLRPAEARSVATSSSSRLDAELTRSLSASLSSSSSTRLDAKLTQTGAMLGTPAYMAPEQFAGRPTDARTDQFSFCVALYESLYGHRPFAGKTVPALMASVLGGEVLDAPVDGKVPAWLRRTILRGLRRDPSARYPNMEALLDALSRDPAVAVRRRLTLAGAVLAGVAVMAAAGVGLRSPQANVGLCAAGANRLAGIWEPASVPRSVRKLAISQAFAATGSGYAATASASVRQILDRYVAAWTGMYADTCEATHVRGEQSSEVLDLRMSCLGERLGRVKALTDLFAQANATVVENAVVAAGALPSLDRCADIKLLRAVIPPPDDPAAHARVEALKQDVARVRALGDSGQCAAAAAAGKRLIAEARSLGYEPLVAQSLNALARSSSECLAGNEAVQMHREAVLAATASHDDEAAVEAMILLAHAQADRTSEIVPARDWIDLAGAAMRGMSGAHPVLETWRLGALAAVHTKEGRLEQALETYERARKVMEESQGVDHPDMAGLINNIGFVLHEMKRYDEALAHYRNAADLAFKVLGPDRPLAALALGNQAEVLNALHRYEDVRAPIEQALEIWRRAGSSEFYTAWALSILGESLLEQGKTEEARARLEEALAHSQDTKAPYLPRTRYMLARALWPKPAHRGRAVSLARTAKAELAAGGAGAGRAAEAAEIDAWLRRHVAR